MSRLAHATYGAPGFEAEKRNLGKIIQAEITEAKQIQKQLGCTWTEALRIAYEKEQVEDAHTMELAKLYQPYDD